MGRLYYAFVPQDITQRKEEAAQFMNQLEGLAKPLRDAGSTADHVVRKATVPVLVVPTSQ